MTKDETLKLAREALEYHTAQTRPIHETYEAIKAIKEALAQQVQEPVAWLMYKGTHKDSFWLDKGDAYNFEMTPEHRWEPLYTTPQPRPWVGLTFAEICEWENDSLLKFARAIEQALKEKNT